MILSVLLALRPRQTETGIRPPYGGLVGSECASTPENGLIPVEYSCKRP
jgi:hypothetical protein